MKRRVAPLKNGCIEILSVSLDRSYGHSHFEPTTEDVRSGKRSLRARITVEAVLNGQDGVSNAHVRVLVRNNGRRANDVAVVAHAP